MKNHRSLTTKSLSRFGVILLGLTAIASTSSRAAELKFAITPSFFEATPGGEPLGPCHGGLVIDKAGNLYVTTDTKRGIVVF